MLPTTAPTAVCLQVPMTVFDLEVQDQQSDLLDTLQFAVYHEAREQEYVAAGNKCPAITIIPISRWKETSVWCTMSGNDERIGALAFRPTRTSDTER